MSFLGVKMKQKRMWKVEREEGSISELNYGVIMKSRRDVMG